MGAAHLHKMPLDWRAGAYSLGSGSAICKQPGTPGGELHHSDSSTSETGETWRSGLEIGTDRSGITSITGFYNTSNYFLDNASCGCNTTPGGSNFLLLFGGTATFSFSGGTAAFGAYLSGVQNAGETITFSDGTSQSVDIPNPGFDGGTTFVGFIDAGKSIASITINVNNDIVGVDDVRYVTIRCPSQCHSRSWVALSLDLP